MKFDAKHTGQRKRRGIEGNYSDIFLVSLDGKNCAIVDTKAYRSYNLPSKDVNVMENNYIPNCKELFGDKQYKLQFCSYVAGGFADVGYRFKAMHEKTGIPISGISAKALVDLARSNKINRSNQPKLQAMFSQSKVLKSEDFKEL